MAMSANKDEAPAPTGATDDSTDAENILDRETIISNLGLYLHALDAEQSLVEELIDQLEAEEIDPEEIDDYLPENTPVEQFERGDYEIEDDDQEGSE